MKSIFIFILNLCISSAVLCQNCSKLNLKKIVLLSSGTFSGFDDFAIENCYAFKNLSTDENNLTKRKFFYQNKIIKNPEIIVFETGDAYGPKGNNFRQRLILNTDANEIYVNFKKELKSNGFKLVNETLFKGDQIMNYKSKTHTVNIVINSDTNFYKFVFRIEQILQKRNE